MYNAQLFAVGLQRTDYVIVFAYMLGLMGVGWYLSRRQETSEDFFLGGRRMPWLFTGLSMVATLLSTLTYLGTPGEIIKYGIAQSLAPLALPFAFLVVGFIWVPFFMRLNLTSAYEYLELRFGTVSRLLGVSIYLYMRFVWMGAIIYTASAAIAQMTQSTAPQAVASLTGNAIQFDNTQWFYFVLISTGVISTFYTMLGGIRAVIWTDVIQFGILFFGAILTLIIVAYRTGTGPIDWWRETTSAAHQMPPVASWDLSTPRALLWPIIAAFFWHICTHSSDQVALQRYFSTANASSARRTAAVGYVMDGATVFLLSLVGMALLTYYVQMRQELPANVSDPRGAFADQIFPHFIVNGLPVGISGLILAAVFAVAQSSIDSGINSTATVITVDLVRRFRERQLTPRQELRLARALTLLIGTTVTVMGVVITLLKDTSNILELQFRSFNCVLGPLAAMFMAGILFRHVGQKAIVLACLLGCGAGLLMAHMQVIWELPGPSVFLIIPLSWLVTFVAAAVLGALFAPPSAAQVRNLTWQNVMHEEK